MVAAASLAVACGEPASSTPPPEVVATLESNATRVTFVAAASTETGKNTPAPLTLDGRIFGAGPTGVILAHMRPADQTSWYAYAEDLAETGDYTVLTFDFRGYGASTGDKDFDRIDTDLEAAFNFLHDERGLSKIFVIGASMGGTAALIAGPRLAIAGLVSISSPAEFGLLDAVEAVVGIEAPMVFSTSEDDVPAMRSQEALWAAAGEPKEQQIYGGDAHGTALFDGPHAEAFQARMTEFLRTH